MSDNRNHTTNKHVFPTILRNDSESGILRFLYHTKIGRGILWLLIRPTISKIIGSFLNTKLSIYFIKPFMKKNQIDMTRFKKENYQSFNDFFTRKLKVTNQLDKNLISPCDGKLSIYQITNELTLSIKHSIYSVESLIQEKKTAQFYQNGVALVFRLTPDDYHRYHFIDDGTIKMHHQIPGVLHTVRPIALNQYKVFTENAREVTIMKTKNFGVITQIEVGALMVGEIDNYKKTGTFKKGEEKGKFLFGGSTIIWLLEKEIHIKDEIWKNTANDLETIIHYGETIGKRT